MLDVFITSLDEEKALADLIRELSPTPTINIYLIDSGSTDNTVTLAENADFTVVLHPYESQAAQLNWALENVGQSKWVFILDADERIEAPLEVLEVLAEEITHAGKIGGAFRRRNYFGEREIRYGGWSPDWQVRLVNRDYCRYEVRPVHSHVVIARSQCAFLDVTIRHNTYASIDEYWQKLLSYTAREVGDDNFASHRLRYPKIRALSRRIPFRPVAIFLYRYFWRRGFLDGRLGLHLALWSLVYEDVLDARRTDVQLRFPSDRNKW